MNNIYQHYIIDLSSNNNFVQIPTVQGDGNNIRGFEVELIENGVQYEIDKNDCLVAIMGTKPDTSQIMNDCTVSDEGYILVDITSQMSAVKGRGDYQIVLMSRRTNSQLKSFPFHILTTPAAFDIDHIVSSDEFQALTRNIVRTEEVIEDANDAISDMRALESSVSAAELIRISNENTRIQNEIDREQAEKNRMDAENERITAENTRIGSEQNRDDAENIRIANEETRETNETVRNNNETNRINSESDRINAEADRASAEEDRITSENTRKSNEDVRKTNEEARITAESIRNEEEIARTDAENIRVANENIRISNENSRIQNEIDREQAETIRINAETDRVNAEDVRETNENIRIENENARKTEETKRDDAENIRIDNESVRQTNETIRETNESNRQTNTATAISNAEKATDNANAAAEKARVAGEKATAAETTAIEKAAEADNYAKMSQSYAVGTGDVRPDESTDNAKYYSEQSKSYADSWKGSLLPKGTILFSQLPTADNVAGHMYNISDAFETDSRFKDGAGYAYAAGTNVYWTADEKWDCLSGAITMELTMAEYNALSDAQKMNGTIYYISDADNSIPSATENFDGLMSHADKQKLDGIEDGATKVVVDDTISTTSENAIQNRAITNALNTNISNHNSSPDAHTDIRELIAELTTRLNTLADSDDTTLDQLSEIISYIKSNRSLIEGITASNTNVPDIVDSLTSTETDKALSANQGKVLNDLITSLTSIVENKVDKVSGKALSTNDYTTAEKNKLDGIESEANAYSLPLATESVRGGVKVGYTQNDKNYPVQLNDDEQMYVNVNLTPEDIGAAPSNHSHDDMYKITFSVSEPTSVSEGEIVMVYDSAGGEKKKVLSIWINGNDFSGGETGGETGDDEQNLEPGLYDANDVMLASWDELVNDYGLDATTNYTNYSFSSSQNTLYYIMSRYTNLKGTKLVIGTVDSIGNYAFKNCSSLTSIEIPNSVTSIGEYAFHNCSSLTSIKIPNSVTSIEKYAFYYCTSLTSIKVPNSVTSIENNAFDNCNSLTSFEIPNSVTSIKQYVFGHCSSLTSIKIPNSVTSIERYAFYQCIALPHIKIPDSVTSIGGDAFYHCDSLTSIEMSNSILSIESNTFSQCSLLTSIEIPDSVTSIEEYAFRYCIGLKTIYIPQNVVVIEDYTFLSCLSTLKIYCETSSKPSGWSSKYNNYDVSKKLSVTFGVTREEYESTYKE